MKTLPREFYNQPTLKVARELLGKILYYKIPSGPPARQAPGPRDKERILMGRIIETEAYLQNDKACHASRGMTPRNAPMFGKPGFSYVYFTYGMHHCFNVVTQPEGTAEAVLIRSVEPMKGLVGKTDGPAKLCRAFGIDKKLNENDMTRGNFLIKDDGFRPRKIQKATRIGIKLDADKLWRFYY
ncbi:MAG: DNA-3-methyladenine glycosylase [archaeon]